MLSAATQLEHFYLSFTMNIGYNGRSGHIETELEEGEFIRLRSILPIESWPNLRHFGINRVPVHKPEVMSTLGSLPDSLRSVKLSHLAFAKDDNHYRDMLQDMRNNLNWKGRPANRRPRVQIIVNRHDFYTPGHYLCADQAVDKFLYSSAETGNSPNPFGDEHDPSNAVEGLGWTERDYMDPLYEKPYLRNDIGTSELPQ